MVFKVYVSCTYFDLLREALIADLELGVIPGDL